MLTAASRAADSKSYWDDYYASATAPAWPSQFAVFAASEVSAGTVVDLGCGNGRDALFFARHGIRTVGVDASAAAIELCKSGAKRSGLSCVDFLCADIRDSSLASRIDALLRKDDAEADVLIYSRFFLHAIDEEGERALLALARALLERRNGALALEFRTPRDRNLEKVTSEHYRRYVEPAALVAAARDHGFSPLYSVEGFGMAKYKNDDAYVARVMLGLA